MSSGRDFEIFTEAVQLPAEERAAFLERVCAGDQFLQQKVKALLNTIDRAGAFLETPPTGSVGEQRSKAAVGEKPGDRVGRYKLLQQIGEGAGGVVFVAEQEEPIRRRVALKVVKPGMDTRSVIARFEAERQALALMDHPNIARVFDAGATESGRPYFVMELVRGIKITEYCEQKSLTTRERLEVFIKVCEAVQHAHQKGIIHRDIKPSNILVATDEDGAALPKVIDFGIAKAITNQRLTDKTLFTGFEMLIGTPAYMSPEQAVLTSVDVDTRTDIYSLGVLLYELLTGTTPFDSRELLKTGLDEVRRVITSEEPVRPSTRLKTLLTSDTTTVLRVEQLDPSKLISDIRGDLDWIVMKALEKDRARRYATAHGLALDAQRYLAGEAIFARPPSRVYKFRKLVHRNKLVFASAGAIAALLVASLVVVSFAFAREKKASVKSKQVTKFLEAMLNGVGPSVARGRDTKMLREILDETAQRVGKEMAGQPEVEAELRNLLAKLYEQLGSVNIGEDMARRALAIRRKLFGSDSLETAESLNILGKMLSVERKLPEANEVYSQALAIRRRRLGNDSAETAASLDGLAEVLRDQRRLPEADTMANEGLRTRQNLFGIESLEAADSLRNICLIQGYEDKWIEAERTARQVLAIRQKLLGDKDPRVALAMEDLSWTLNARDKFEESQSLHTTALAMLQDLLGDAHPDVWRNLDAQGQLLGRRGDLEGSEGLLRAALSIQRKLLGEDDQATVGTLCSLAKTLHDRGKKSEAESTWREALTIGRKYWALNHPDRLYALGGMCDTLEAEGKWSEAEALWRETLSYWRQRGGIEDKESLNTLRRLGICLECSGKWPEAESVYWEVLTLSRKKGDTNPEVLIDLDRVARALMAQKKLAEAQRLLDGILTPAFAAKPESVNLVTLRLNVMARQGRWQEAAADAALALENQLTDHYRYHTLAALLAMTGDRPAYEQLCKRLVSKFADPTNAFVSERIVQDCLLLPNSGVDLMLMDKLADKAVTAGIGTDGLPYFQACKAMSHYRLGNFSEAIGWAEKAATSSSDFAQAKAFAVLAMANWQLGQKEAARRALVRGSILAPNFLPESGEDLGDSWVAWIMARVSLDEAAGLIQTGSTTDKNSNPP